MADGRLLSRRSRTVHDMDESLRLLTLAKSSSYSHMRRKIQSAYSSTFAPQFHTTYALQVPVCCTPSTPSVVQAADKRTDFSERPTQVLENFLVRQVSRWKSLTIQSLGIQSIPFCSSVNEMHSIVSWFVWLAISTAVKDENTMNTANQCFHSTFDHSAIWRLHPSVLRIAGKSGNMNPFS